MNANNTFLLFGSFDQHPRKFDTIDEVLRFHDNLSTLTYPVQTINAISYCWILSLSNNFFWRGLWFICQYCVIPGSFSVWYNIHIIIFKSSIYQFIFIQLSYAKMCEKQFRSFINFYVHKTLQDVLGWILPLIFDEDKQLPTNNVP